LEAPIAPVVALRSFQFTVPSAEEQVENARRMLPEALVVNRYWPSGHGIGT